MFYLCYVARRLCFAIWMSGHAGGFLFLVAVPGGTLWSGPVLRFCGPFCRFPPGRWTSCRFVEDCRSVSLARCPSLHCWVLLLPGDHDRDLSSCPASVDSLGIGDSRPVFPSDEGSQHGHEMGSRIHPAQRPGLKNCGLARYLCSPLAGYPLPQIRPV